MTISESFKLSIIVPAYNEGKTILTVLQKLNNLKKFYQNIHEYKLYYHPKLLKIKAQLKFLLM